MEFLYSDHRKLYMKAILQRKFGEMQIVDPLILIPAQIQV